MRYQAAALAVVAVLLSVTPASAETYEKVDPTKIKKLTAETAPEPTLADKLAAPFKSSGGGKGSFIDPSKTDHEPMKAPETPPPPKVAPSPAESGFEPVVIETPKPEALKNDVKKAAPAKTDTKADAKKSADAQKDAAAEPAAEPAVSAPATEEKKGWQKYLPW